MKIIYNNTSLQKYFSDGVLLNSLDIHIYKFQILVGEAVVGTIALYDNVFNKKLLLKQVKSTLQPGLF